MEELIYLQYFFLHVHQTILSSSIFSPTLICYMRQILINQKDMYLEQYTLSILNLVGKCQEM